MRPCLLLLVSLLTTIYPNTTFAQGTLLFANDSTSLVRQQTWDLSGSVPLPKGGGMVQLFWAPTGTAYTPWNPGLTPTAWYAANPGWSLEPAVGFTTPAAGRFNGGILTLSPLAPGGTIDYAIIAWTGSSPTLDIAMASGVLLGVSDNFTSATGNPTLIPPGFPVSLADSFGGMTLAIIPEPSGLMLLILGVVLLPRLHRFLLGRNATP